ncbi:hypothetical protein [Oscillatoria acuminata]|nr:hypothetical protein [Oscillatoria acuminata]
MRSHSCFYLAIEVNGAIGIADRRQQNLKRNRLFYEMFRFV